MFVIFASCAIVKLENNASPSLPAAIYSQIVGGGSEGPQCKILSKGPQLFCDATGYCLVLVT